MLIMKTLIVNPEMFIFEEYVLAGTAFLFLMLAGVVLKRSFDNARWAKRELANLKNNK
ncbi:hypothetical protein Molly5_8 [Maribacter phage Molly_5]|uniref:Heme exporter protein D n=1 Tax=Maribacter phage Molly_1 TaxID=2745685 RepID=A0A8E4UYI2_9CAUD|nr:hypothetical protein M1M29_gp008 [Maribacter phage Molly_1]QQO97766.1 hypothetical protein Molly2_8 [Maribacter phage Molly_2]QQO97966.1 hypothetical protein Molly3_8 [Maribacter phage Molly_3]QQO98166.1 hypothetical protein Molly4_8 [Maribacter phage Molly_4]QQO98366.1 hypothetical protein Molly5_8 [Maribacter phage Molly_5]QQO97566.1 hypothetical protein Molly1_8 [Maribacter phage Molly_1]